MFRLKCFGSYCEEHPSEVSAAMARSTPNYDWDYEDGKAATGLRTILIESILKSHEDKMWLVKTEEKLSEDVQVLLKDISAARASQQELSSRKSNTQQEIAFFKQWILIVEKRVPELEAEKKVAAAARTFKEAARIAAEAKS
ncbi:uncharacterized protein LOC122316937 isoform X2 [Carya illinoinensis]|uniref:uncharacterized protein LOC122316937 isoform X2 n=1 Tax=Carya illinoinensis TaxID=32201 RepID=UPI001C727143|nr:uncharacterized protein LOC122316937 isoform X2 [Carya illinoinensis]